MKKFVIFTLIIAMAAGAAFAQTANGISVNAWGRGAFAPIRAVGAMDEYVDNQGATVPEQDATTLVGAGVSWGDDTRTDFRINGNADFAGFAIQITEGGIDGGDFRYIWVKPFSNDIIKLYVGKYVDDTLRGKIGNLDGGFSNFVGGGPGIGWAFGPKEEDPIFTRFETNAGERRLWRGHDFGWGGNSQGFMLSSAPVEGLFLGINVISPFGWNATEADDIYRFIQIGAGYEIADIGHIRAQYIGGYFGTDGDETDDNYKANDRNLPARIEAAFALTAVQNLLVDLGLKFWLPVEGNKDNVGSNGGEWSKSSGVDVSVGATFRADAFNIGGRVDATGIGSYTRANDKDESTDNMGLQVHLVPAYDFDAFTLGLSIGINVTMLGKDSGGEAADPGAVTQFGFGGFISKGLGSGSVKAGLTYTTAPTYDGDVQPGTAGIFQIPVILEYAFF